MPSGSGKALIRRLGAISVPVLVGFVGYGWWRSDEPARQDSPEAAMHEADPAANGTAVPESLFTDQPDALPADVRPGSMRATLLETQASNRAHILRLAIVDEGHACAEVVSAAAVGENARVWRTRCSGGDTYWVSVDELDRLVVEPVPYGDIDPAIAAPPTVEPRTLELDDTR